MPADPFVYPALDHTKDQIRLLEYHRSSNGDLKHTYTMVSLEDKPDFCALSYVWGSDEATKFIVVDGQRFPVRPNLYDFLVQSAAESADLCDGGASGAYYTLIRRSKPIFIDAICINQSDLEERNAQVRLMADLYRQAEVIVWFGSEAHWVPGLVQRFPEVTIAEVMESCLCGQSYEFGEDNINYICETVKSALEVHGYWTRVWTVQEFLTPPDLTLKAGAVSFRCEAFHALVVRLFEGSASYGDYEGLDVLAMTQPQHIPGMPRSKKWYESATARRRALLCRAYLDTRHDRVVSNATSSRMPLHRALRFSREQERSERKDGVYGILGLTNSLGVPDYSLSAAQIFTATLMEGLVEIAAEELDRSTMAKSRHLLLHDDLLVNLGLDHKDETLLLVTFLLLIINDFFYFEMFVLLGYIKSQRRKGFGWGTFEVMTEASTLVGVTALDDVDHRMTMWELGCLIGRLKQIEYRSGRRSLAHAKDKALAQCIELTDRVLVEWNVSPEKEQVCLARFVPRTRWQIFKPKFGGNSGSAVWDAMDHDNVWTHRADMERVRLAGTK
ncbi:hypothetical protein LTR15_011235 [Elasticomyces elasticus]|nr:hypothetical protein LTR15_011235 [Elasticomyces elasticus]